MPTTAPLDFSFVPKYDMVKNLKLTQNGFFNIPWAYVTIPIFLGFSVRVVF